MRCKLKPLVFAVMTACSTPVWADTFVVEDIEIDGLQRINAATVFTYLPVKVGEAFDEADTARIIRELFATGFFSDVSLRRRDNVLIVVVDERPAINDIRMSGNKDIKTEDILEAVRHVGLAKGRVYNPSILEQVRNELRQQYFARGKYNVAVDVTTERLPRNRVDVVIDVREGGVARIRKVTIVGNESYDGEKLTKGFESGIPSRFMLFSKRDHYSRQKLAGDIEKLRSHYLDSGFLNFDITSTQVTITPDRKDIFITINLDEGAQYTVGEVVIGGTPVLPEDELKELISVQPGEAFSRGALADSTAAITKRLGDEGYAFANVNPIPTVDEINRKVALTFFIDPGRRTYVRRINFAGNARTNDEVYRREMRQMENALYSASAIERSRIRIQRLTYVESVNFEVRRVSGTDDQVDIEVAISERLSGNLTLGVGYSQSDGILLNLGVSQENFMGTGNRVSVNVNNSSVNKTYSFSYNNPYYTEDGISRGYNIFYRETDAAEAEISSYSSNRYGASITYGVPLTEFTTVRISPKIEQTEILTGSDTPTEIFDFLSSHGDNYSTYGIEASYIYDTRDRALLAKKGATQRLTLEAILPGSDVTYYKVDYRALKYFPFGESYALAINGDIGYGKAFGDTLDLPFFEKYVAGGPGSVRGFRARSLGPRDSNNEPFGGNFRISGTTELIVPATFLDMKDQVSLGLFADFGQVFADFDDFDASDIRMSAGIGATWLSPMGALTFSLAAPLNEQKDDETEVFQFTFGTNF